MLIAVLLLALLALASCKRNDDNNGEEFLPSDVTGDVVDRTEEGSYRFRVVTDRMTGNAGTLDYIMQYPVFEGDGFEIPSAYIEGAASGFLKKIGSNLKSSANETTEMNASLDIAVKEFGKEYLSLLITTTENMGGSHEDVGQTGAVFYLPTGKRLCIGDIADPDLAADCFISEIEKSDKADMLFEGYRSTVDDLVKEEGAWYLENNTITLICPPYLIAPYAAGWFMPVYNLETAQT